MGKPTINDLYMAIFNSFFYVYQRVSIIEKFLQAPLGPASPGGMSPMSPAARVRTWDAWEWHGSTVNIGKKMDLWGFQGEKLKETPKITYRKNTYI